MSENNQPTYSIIANGALQFIDYDIDLSVLNGKKPLAKRRFPFHIAEPQGGGRHILALLSENENEPGRYFGPNEKPMAMHYEIEVQRAFEACLGQWLPVPFLARSRIGAGRQVSFGYGPTDWARLYLSRTGAEGDPRYRLTLVFDPQVEDNSSDLITEDGVRIYHALSEDDVTQNILFGLAGHPYDNAWFYNELPWVQEAVKKCREASRQPDGRLIRVAQPSESLPASYEDPSGQSVVTDDMGMYITFLMGLELSGALGQVRVVNPARAASFIDVDLVLDIGNSRMTGVLVETKPQSDTRLTDCYILPIRDLSEPAKTYAEPVDTKVEFAEPYFGEAEWSMKSRRHGDSFRWPSTVRLGPEATRLAQAAREDKGPTGMSSPKRYLWDTRQRDMLWYLNNKYERHGSLEEMAAARGPFLMQVNVAGVPLAVMPGDDGEENAHFRELPQEIKDGLDGADNFWAAESRYSRSSMMMFLLGEIIAQAVSAINNPMIREGRGHSDAPRRLSRVILTVPTAMPLIEQRIFKTWAKLAVRTVWSAMAWDACYRDNDAPAREAVHDFRSSPIVRCDWDEATCTQVVWLYNEVCERFHKNARELFDLMGRPRPPLLGGPEAPPAPSLRIASIDMGGGTTDLSVTTYFMHNPDNAAPLIRPHLDFRDGFNVAGDDIMYKIIVAQLLDKIGRAAKEAGVPDAESLVSSLFHETPQMGLQPKEGKRLERVRSQFVEQVAVPVALHILREYEKYDPTAEEGLNFSFRVGDIVGPFHGLPEGAERPRDGRLDEILNYLENGLNWPGFSLFDHRLDVDLREVDENVSSVLDKIMADMGEVVKLYDCDLLILTGRPSRWPAMMRAPYRRLCLPADRVTHMHQYRVSARYPFVVHGRIEDPKTTVVVGAIICALAEGSLEGVTIDTSMFDHQPTTRYLGLLDGRGQMDRPHEWFSDINVFSEEKLELEKEVDFNAPVPVGFRQLAIPRWTTTRLYSLEYRNLDYQREAYGRLPYKLTLQYILEPFEEPDEGERRKLGRRRRTEGRLKVAVIEDRTGASVNREAIQIRLQTLRHDEGYWLDTGILNSN